MIPDLKPLIQPLTSRFESAWRKARAPHDDGEFNARVCAVLHYEMGLTQVGRNGKRGDPSNLSRDIINWQGEGPNPDPINGGFGTIIDFIIGHESAGASIGQIYPDPNGPGAWVTPLTLAQIDAGGAPPPPPPAIILPGSAEMMDEGQRLHAYYAAHEGLQRPLGLSINNAPDWAGVGAWLFDVYLAARVAGKSREESRAAYVSAIRHTDEWQTKHPGETP